jgi:hypothetical protein
LAKSPPKAAKERKGGKKEKQQGKYQVHEIQVSGSQKNKLEVRRRLGACKKGRVGRVKHRGYSRRSLLPMQECFASPKAELDYR